jgi:hypothetical protein
VRTLRQNLYLHAGQKEIFTGCNVSDHTAVPDLNAELHYCAVGGD